MEEIYSKLNELYDLHDYYFCDNKKEKQNLLQNIINLIIELLDQLPNDIRDKNISELLYIRGKALNALDYTQQQEGDQQEQQEVIKDYLSKSIKLNPNNVQAWMTMGQYEWKLGNIKEAKKMFLESLKHEETKEAYQDLSMIIRQLSSVRRTNQDVDHDVDQDDDDVPQERSEIMKESIKLAKKAISMDINDHKSWYILGNALCMNFFTVTHDVVDLKKALTAYKKSESLGGECNPDLYYNQGNVHRYLQNYSEALKCYQQTYDIDPSSFSQTNDSLQDVSHFVNRVNDLVQHKVYVKKKKLTNVLKTLSQSKWNESTTCFKDLIHGVNSHTKICVKVLMTVTKVSIPPECFVCTDLAGDCAVVSIYNLSSDAPPLTSNQVITIIDPVVNKNAFNLTNESEKQTGDNDKEETVFTSSLSSCPPAMLVQVHQIENVKVDGKPIASKILAAPQLKVDMFSS